LPNVIKAAKNFTTIARF